MNGTQIFYNTMFMTCTCWGSNCFIVSFRKIITVNVDDDRQESFVHDVRGEDVDGEAVLVAVAASGRILTPATTCCTGLEQNRSIVGRPTLLCGMVRAYHPVAVDSNPKHTIYAFFNLYYLNCNEKRTKKQKEAGNGLFFLKKIVQLFV